MATSTLTILRVPEEEQAQLLAQTLSALGFLQKSGLSAKAQDRRTSGRGANTSKAWEGEDLGARKNEHS
jgi:hypothetical protein